MCGIAGFFGEIARAPGVDSLLESMTAALAHRGPDGESRWLGPDAGLGHTRLAIIDLASGNQPMWSACEQHVIVFNGEIYNYPELREQLLSLGYQFRTRSDTEVIWAAIDAWGIERGLLSLRGMFAFALYNTRERTLLLARDRVGIKPMFLARMAQGIAFASEPKALLRLPSAPRRLNPAAIHDFLGTGYATAPATCWSDIEVLEPGSWLKLTPGGEQRGRYWKWSPQEHREMTLRAATERVEATLRDAVRSHLISDVPVGTFLSGGLDSSLITALLAGTGERTRTFSVGFSDSAFDEAPYARQVAKKFGADHTEIQLSSGEGDPDLFRAVVEQYDEPFGDSSCIPTYLICREVRKQLKVVLSGDGGDEVLGGYTRYVNARRIASLARLNGFLPKLKPFTKFAQTSLGRFGRQAAKAWSFAQMPAVERLSALQSYFSEEQRRWMYQPDFASLAAGKGTTADRLRPFVPEHLDDPIQQMITTEMRLRLHADYLRKVDVASSAHGLEVRVPFLDANMLDLAAELPVNFKIAADGETKILSRRLAQKYLPAGCGTRAKQGFSIPLDRWCSAKMRDFFQDILLDSRARSRSILRPEAIGQVWSAFASGEPTAQLSRYQRYQQLFLLASLELWLRRWSPAIP
jgi:asparagine synthase (glutamine-hydrolysing)